VANRTFRKNRATLWKAIGLRSRIAFNQLTSSCTYDNCHLDVGIAAIGIFPMPWL